MSAPSAIRRLLALPASQDLLARWVERAPGKGSPVERLQAALLEHTRTDPEESLRAVAHATASASTLTGIERARFIRLEGHVLRLTGRAPEAAERYSKAWSAFVASKASREAGLTAIGWVDALNLAGKPREALRVGRAGRRRLPASDRQARARLDTNLATTLYFMGRFAEAATSYRSARHLFLRSREPFAAGLASFNLGNACLRLGRLAEARARYTEARDAFEGLKLAVPTLYARHSLAALDLAEGRWEEGTEALRSLEASFASLGDERAVAAMHRELGGLFASLGATEAARPSVSAALATYRRLGLHHEAAQTAFLDARIFLEQEAYHDAEVRLDEVLRHATEAGNAWTKRQAEVSSARLLTRRGEPRRALALLAKAQATLDRDAPQSSGALCRAATAEACIALGRFDRALSLAKHAHHEARDYPATLERPWMALLVAKAHAGLGDGTEALRWGKRSAGELEALLLRFASRGLRAMTSRARDRIYGDAVDLALRHGGKRAAETALDLLSRSRSPRLVEDLLRGREARGDRDLRAALAKLRDDILAAGEPEAPDVRFRALRDQASRLEARLGAGFEATTVARTAWLARGLKDWKPRLGERDLVFYDHARSGWRAFVTRRRGPVIVVALPQAEDALRRVWLPLRLLLETAAHAPTRRRAAFFSRTRRECDDALQALRTALWDPLPLEGQRVVVIPAGPLHGVPIESLDLSRAVSRLPHPALLDAPRRRRRRMALLLSGGEPGARREIHRVRDVLRGASYRVSVGDRVRHLREAGSLGLLHVAAHGTYHRKSWLLSGLRLEDGWVGFEQLAPRSVRDALLYFSSCESGLSAEAPGAELDGWIAAGLGAGAREMVLTLWKVDDASATAFADRFYPRWIEGRSASEAAYEARRDLMQHFEHPFSWAPFIAVG